MASLVNSLRDNLADSLVDNQAVSLLVSPVDNQVPGRLVCLRAVQVRTLHPNHQALLPVSRVGLLAVFRVLHLLFNQLIFRLVYPPVNLLVDPHPVRLLHQLCIPHRPQVVFHRVFRR